MRGPIDDDGGEGFYKASKERIEKESKTAEKPDSQTKEEEKNLKRYKPSNTKSKTKGWSTRKKAAGILLGLGITGSLLGLVFSFLQGPLQFLQLANTAQRLYSHIEDLSTNRGGKLIRHLRHRDNPANRRMGIIGNRVTDKIRTKLEADGMVLKINNAGYLEGIEYKGRDISLEGESNRTRRAEFRAALKDMGYGKIVTAVASRPIFQKFGIDLKPFGNIKRKAGESLRDFKNRIRQAKTDEINSHFRFINCDRCVTKQRELNDELNKPADQQDQNKIRELRGELDRLVANAEANKSTERTRYEGDGTQREKTRAAGEAIRSKILRPRGSVIAIAGLAFCTVRQMGGDIIQSERLKAETAINLAAEANSMADQIKAGTGGINMDELAVSAERFDDPEGNSWIQNDKVNYVMTGEATGTKQSPATVIGDAKDNTFVNMASLFDKAELGVVNLDNFCRIMGNLVVQGVLVVGEVTAAIFTGGVFGVAKVAMTEAAFEIANWFVSDAASGYVAAAVGDPIPAMVSGPDYGAVVMTGSLINSNILAMEQGGRNLNSAESLELQAYLDKQNGVDNDYKNIADKYFDATQPDTLAGGLYATALNGSVGNPLKEPSSILNTIASSIMKPFTNRVFAASTEEVFDGIKQIGFSVSEFDGPIGNEDPLQNEQRLYRYFGNETKIDEAIDKCINEFPLLGQDNSINKNYLNPGTPGDCPVDGEMLVRLRLYALDLNVLNSMACMAGDRTSCSEMEIDSQSTETTPSTTAGSEIVGDPLADSTDIDCAPGTKELGEYDAYVRGKKIPSKMCSITNFKSTSSANGYIDGAEGWVIVNSRVSGAVLAMYNKALADDVTLVSNSSFRSHEHQTKLFNDCVLKPSCTPGTHVATPGYSSHESGTAIDFEGVSGKSSGRTCETRMRDPSNKVWQWLEANARDFGYKQYVNEAWHWDTLESSSRC